MVFEWLLNLSLNKMSKLDLITHSDLYFSLALPQRKVPKEKSSQKKAAITQAYARPLFWRALARHKLKLDNFFEKCFVFRVDSYKISSG